MQARSGLGFSSPGASRTAGTNATALHGVTREGRSPKAEKPRCRRQRMKPGSLVSRTLLPGNMGHRRPPGTKAEFVLRCSCGLQGVLPWTSANSSDNCGVCCPFVFEGPALGGDEASQGESLIRSQKAHCEAPPVGLGSPCWEKLAPAQCTEEIVTEQVSDKRYYEIKY